MPTTNSGPSVSTFVNEVPLRGTFDPTGKLLQILGPGQTVAYDPTNVAITGGTINGVAMPSNYNPAAVAITGGTISGVSSVAVAGPLTNTGTVNFGSGAVQTDISGNLLVGTTTFGQPDANAAAIGRDGTLRAHHATGTANGALYTYFTYGGSGIGYISQSGTTAVLYSTTSDARLKTNVVNAPDAASLIDSIQVRSFDWLSDGSHQRYGMVAQELYEVAPEAVSKPADPDEMMAVDYSKLVPMLIKELQSLRARVAQLEGI